MNKEEEDFDCVIELENLLGVSLDRTLYYLDITSVTFTDNPVAHLYNLAKNLTKIQKEKAIKYLMLRKELYIYLNKLGVYEELKQVIDLPTTYIDLIFKVVGLQQAITASKRAIKELELTTSSKDFSIRPINK